MSPEASTAPFHINIIEHVLFFFLKLHPVALNLDDLVLALTLDQPGEEIKCLLLNSELLSVKLIYRRLFMLLFPSSWNTIIPFPHVLEKYAERLDQSLCVAQSETATC